MGLLDFLKPKNIMVEQNDANIPLRPINNSSDAEFVVEDVFSITGRGTVVTGQVTKGILKLGDEVIISPSGIRTYVECIEQFRKTLDCVHEGDKAGILLQGVSKNQVHRGDILVK